MRFFARHLLIILICSLGFVPASHAAPQGVEMLRAALQESESDSERDHKIREALPILRADAIRGDAKAQYNLARLYETGIPSGATRTLVTFPARSYAWYVAAARQNHPLAIKRLAAADGRAIEANPSPANEAVSPPPDASHSLPALSPSDQTAMGLSAGYQLKIASFRNPANAAALVELLAEEGVIALSQRREDAKSGEWHVVTSAPVFSKTEAETLRAGLKRNYGVDPDIQEITAPSAGE